MTFQQKLVELSETAKREMEAVISHINTHFYTPAIVEAQAILAVEKKSYIGELWQAMRPLQDFWSALHGDCYGEKMKMWSNNQQEVLGEIEFVILDNVYAQFHVLNASYACVKIDPQKLMPHRFFKEREKGVWCHPKTGDIWYHPHTELSPEAIRNARGYITALPQQITMENVLEIVELHKKFLLLQHHHNANGMLYQLYQNPI